MEKNHGVKNRKNDYMLLSAEGNNCGEMCWMSMPFTATVVTALILQTNPGKIAVIYLNARKHQAMKLQSLISSVIAWRQITGFLVLTHACQSWYAKK